MDNVNVCVLADTLLGCVQAASFIQPVEIVVSVRVPFFNAFAVLFRPTSVYATGDQSGTWMMVF